jgi:hypothetical protein
MFFYIYIIMFKITDHLERTTILTLEEYNQLKKCKHVMYYVGNPKIVIQWNNILNFSSSQPQVCDFKNNHIGECNKQNERSICEHTLFSPHELPGDYRKCVWNPPGATGTKAWCNPAGGSDLWCKKDLSFCEGYFITPKVPPGGVTPGQHLCKDISNDMICSNYYQYDPTTEYYNQCINTSNLLGGGPGYCKMDASCVPNCLCDDHKCTYKRKQVSDCSISSANEALCNNSYVDNYLKVGGLKGTTYICDWSSNNLCEQGIQQCSILL